ncbi:MFS transporter [Simiduia aestuariiviva]|uniref:DHA1 family bicyclomycin/chloramphenicol resistance-like MFS transporter n=1 Tax=Simiduia aestuariiviva TaxID=1510459 RepID=A0A839UHK6_9GAMM|nr:MFS transporter [Simiduia aestuariiviva]MBB3167342.1 DHA1 family bicyclomycin/chloramphenicol resistance-like MFS transporter [Simiduia aestuariiviva]
MSSTRFMIVIAAMVALSPLAMDSYLPAMPLLAEHLGVTTAAVSWTVSNFLLGLAAGQLLGGAISDQKGRRPVALIGLLVFTASSLLLVWSSNLWWANGWRLLQGFGGGLIMVAASAIVKDVTPPEKLAAQIAQIVFVVMLTPILAPIVGSAMLPLGWQSIFLLSFGAAVVMLLVVAMAVPETNLHKTGQLSLSAGLAQYRYVWQFRKSDMYLARWQALSLSFSGLLGLVFVTVSSPLLMESYGLSGAEFPYAFGAFAVSILLGNRLGKWLVVRHAPARIFRTGVWVQLAAVSVLVAAALAWQPPLWLMLATIMVAIGTGAAIGPSGSAMFLNVLDRYFGSATAFETTVRFSLGGLLGSVATVLPMKLPLAMALIMLISILVSIMLTYVTRRAWQP